MRLRQAGMCGMTRLLGILAILLMAARLFTGTVFEFDEPTSYFVLKHAPSLAIMADNTADRRVRDDYTVLDSEENELVYERAYVWLMQWAPVLAAGCAAGWLAGKLTRPRGR